MFEKRRMTWDIRKTFNNHISLCSRYFSGFLKEPSDSNHEDRKDKTRAKKTQAEERKRSWTKGERSERSDGLGGREGGRQIERGWEGEELNRKGWREWERLRAWQWQSERASECEWKADRKAGIHVEHKAASLTVRLYLSLALPLLLLFSPVS